MHFLSTLFASITLFFGSLFGFSHPAPVPAVPVTQTATSSALGVLSGGLAAKSPLFIWVPVGTQDPAVYKDYVEENGKIYYVDGWGLHHPISVADAPTFVVLVRTTGDKNSTLFAKDKDHVYWFGGALDSANPDTFAPIFTPGGEQANCYIRDKNHVYFLCGTDSPYFVKGADAMSFKVLTNEISVCPDASDKYHDYCGGIAK